MEQKEVVEAVRKAMREEMKDFYNIDRETHYKDHEFILGLREWTKDFKSAFWAKIANGFAYVVLTVIIAIFALKYYRCD